MNWLLDANWYIHHYSFEKTDKKYFKLLFRTDSLEYHVGTDQYSLLVDLDSLRVFHLPKTTSLKCLLHILLMIVEWGQPMEEYLADHVKEKS